LDKTRGTAAQSDTQWTAERGVAFSSLHEGIDTGTSTGRLIFHIFAALAEFERELIAERAAVGREAARVRGRVGGRPAKLSVEQIALARARYADQDVTVAQIAKAFGVGRGTIYRALQQGGGG
jgi:DNA invertase Pin-like site-specific DNA recombinase